MNDSPISLPRPTRPLPSRTKIEYCGIPATVVFDHGHGYDNDDRIEVVAYGYRQWWYWRFDGIDCQVISLPNE